MKKLTRSYPKTVQQEVLNNYSCNENTGQSECNYPGWNMARTLGLNALTPVKGTTENTCATAARLSGFALSEPQHLPRHCSQHRSGHRLVFLLVPIAF